MVRNGDVPRGGRPYRRRTVHVAGAARAVRLLHRHRGRGAGHGRVLRPWPNREKYRYVWPIEIVTELPEPLRIRWSELDSIAGIGGVPASQLPPIADERTAEVRRLFGSASAERLVEVEAADSVRRDLQKITNEHDARVAARGAIMRRQGQGRFRQQLLDAYAGRCCMTACDVEPVLEAAHISPYRGAHTNRVWNGLLLRADLHTLFDLDRLTVLPDGVIRLDPTLSSSAYAELDRQRIRPTSAPDHAPAPEVLRQHNARCDWLS